MPTRSRTSTSRRTTSDAATVRRSGRSTRISATTSNPVGVEPDVAERLIVAGFFEAIADQVPIAGTRPLIGRALADRSGVLGD